MKPILEIKNISKKFNINQSRQAYLSLRESLFSFGNKKKEENFWALKDVSFDVLPGDSVGIIGKNGAGKSTLLKILSRITPPTSGKIISRGRVASLLEVGTGFHPELTGRENVFLNASILGMKRREILSRFDEMVDFSGVEKFLDTPLKRYSTGMQLRLAFAVAAFLEPEVLIIDEVLAVGDIEFQKKCLTKMEDVSHSGRTLIIVSHNLGVVSSLCNKGVLLVSGEVKETGTADQCLKKYLKNFDNYGLSFKPESPIGKKHILLESAKVEYSGKVLSNSSEVTFSAIIQVTDSIGFSSNLFMSREGELSFISSDFHKPLVTEGLEKGRYQISYEIPPYILNPGYHSLGIMFSDLHGNFEQFLNLKEIINFEIMDDGFRRGGRYNLGWEGAVSPLLNSTIIKL